MIFTMKFMIIADTFYVQNCVSARRKYNLHVFFQLRLFGPANASNPLYPFSLKILLYLHL